MRTTSTGQEFYHTDALGSVLALTDQTGTVQTRYAYDPFGNTTVTGTSTNPFQYTGRENDGTGLYYYRARYYSPTMQRFISEDPIGFYGGDVNFYAYVGNNPIVWKDPSGTSIASTVGRVIGGAVGLQIHNTNGPAGLISGIVVETVVTGLLISTGVGIPVAVTIGFIEGELAEFIVASIFDNPCFGQANCGEQRPPTPPIPPPPGHPPAPPTPPYPPCKGRKC